MACQVLNCFGIYRRMNEVGNVGMPQLMWSNLKIQAVNHLAIMSCLFSKNGGNRKLSRFIQSVPCRERPHQDCPDADRAEHPHAGDDGVKYHKKIMSN